MQSIRKCCGSLLRSPAPSCYFKSCASKTSGI
jgi:hypothetical protein